MEYRYHALLGLPITATEEDVKKAYRNLAKQFHPDIAGNSQQTVEHFREIKQAYEYIMSTFQYPNYGQMPYTPPNYTPPPPQESHFQSYTWEPMKAEAPPPPKEKKAEAPPPPPPEPPPPEIPFVSVIPQELLLATRLEARQSAVRRVARHKGDQKAQLDWDVKQFLQEDYTVERNPGMLGFSVTANKTGKKVNVRSAPSKSSGISSFFRGKDKI